MRYILLLFLLVSSVCYAENYLSYEIPAQRFKVTYDDYYLKLGGSNAEDIDIGTYDWEAGGILITDPSTPASATATGEQGQIEYDTGYLYLCVSADTWRRLVLSSW